MLGNDFPAIEPSAAWSMLRCHRCVEVHGVASCGVLQDAMPSL